jgi:hypothetical protein
MDKTKLLKEYVKAVLQENTSGLHGPFAKCGKNNTRADDEIGREMNWPFPIENMMPYFNEYTLKQLAQNPNEIEWIIGIDVDYYTEGPDRRVGIMNASTIIENFTVVSIGGCCLSSKADQQAATDALGELTEREKDSLISHYIDNQDDDCRGDYEYDEMRDREFDDDFFDGGGDPFEEGVIREVVNPHDLEFASIEDFSQFLLDDDRDTFTHEELQALNMRTHKPVLLIRKELEAIGFKLAFRPNEKEVRGFKTSSHDRWFGPGSQKTHGGSGIDNQTGRATVRGKTI